MRTPTGAGLLCLLAIVAPILVAFSACTGDEPGLAGPETDNDSKNDSTASSGQIEVVGASPDTAFVYPGDTLRVRMDELFRAQDSAPLQFDVDPGAGWQFVFEYWIDAAANELSILPTTLGSGRFKVIASAAGNRSAEFVLVISVEDPGCPPDPSTYASNVLPLEVGYEIRFDIEYKPRPQSASDFRDYYGTVVWTVTSIECDWTESLYSVLEEFDGIRETRRRANETDPDSINVDQHHWTQSLTFSVTRESIGAGAFSPPGIPLSWPADVAGDTLFLESVESKHEDFIRTEWTLSRSSGIEEFYQNRRTSSGAITRTMTRIHDWP